MSEHHQTTLMADGEGIIRMVSASAADLLGTTSRDLEGLPLHALLETPAPEVVSAVLRSLEGQSGLDGGAVRMAARLRLPDGRLTEIDLHLSRVAHAGPGEAATLVRIVEVEAGQASSAGAAQPQAGESPALPAEVKTAVIDDAYLVCRAGQIIQAGGGLEALTGLPPARMIGWNIKSLIASEDLMPVIEIIREVEQDLDGRNDFGFHLLRAGQLPPLEVAARARRITHRSAPAVLIGLRDISESLRSARMAADRITHLDAALEATGDAVMILGHPAAASPILLVSRTVDAFFDVRGTSWIGKPFREFWEHLRGSLAPAAAEGDAEVQPLPDNAEEIRLDRVMLARPEGRVLEKYLGPLKSPRGAVVGRICIFRDITRRVQAEMEMRRSAQEAGRARAELEMLHEEVRLANEGLERRLSDMQRLNKDLKVLDEMKSNLLANVSHELQTPLVSIKGLTEMILKGRLGSVTPEQERGLQVALRNINRLIGLIENLLAFARTEGPTTTLKLEAFPLEALVNEAIELVAERASGRGITIRTQLPPEPLIIRADRDKILQVLLNLVSNAVKYNRDGGEVLVEANSGSKGAARIEVRDSGIGVPREDLDRIFDRYYQAGNVTQPREGEGIGLSITKDILRQHGCMIRADSEEGKGSLFSFTLPLDRKPRQERGIPRSGVPGRESSDGDKDSGAPSTSNARPRPASAREES